jgi:hypothetical protein
MARMHIGAVTDKAFIRLTSVIRRVTLPIFQCVSSEQSICDDLVARHPDMAV